MFKKLILGMLFSTSAFAGEYHLLNMEAFDMRFQKFEHQRDPYAMEYTDSWSYRASVNFKYSLLGKLYHENQVHTEGIDSGTVKTVGWHWIVGLRLHPNVDVFHEHHSRHIMEDSRPRVNGRNQFPVEDSYGIKLIIVDDPVKGRTIFK